MNGNLLQINVNYLTIIATFAGGINIQAKRMNMQKRKSERMETENRKTEGKAARREEGGKE